MNLLSYPSVNDTAEDPEMFDFNILVNTVLPHVAEDTIDYISSDIVTTPGLSSQDIFSDWKGNSVDDPESVSSGLQSATTDADIPGINSSSVCNSADDAISPFRVLCATDTGAKELAGEMNQDRVSCPYSFLQTSQFFLSNHLLLSIFESLTVAHRKGSLLSSLKPSWGA